MKRAKNLIQQIILWSNLQQAYFKARRGKQMKPQVRKFSNNLDENLHELQRQLLSGKVDVGHYNYFKIYDPKERLICSARFEERVLHHAIMNVCHPYFDKHLIDTTYATRIGKGTYAALNKARQGAKKYEYVAKLDVRKYFDNISHEKLKACILHLFKDQQLLSILFQIIDSYCVTDGFGLPIGNLTSQYFANHYLSVLDHKIKEEWKIPIYVRYMDDMLLFDNDKWHLRTIVREVDKFLKEELLLQLKVPQILTTCSGVSFCGYKIVKNKFLLNSRSKHRLKRKYTLYNTLLDAGCISQGEFQAHCLPLFAFAQKAYTKKLRSYLLNPK